CRLRASHASLTAPPSYGRRRTFVRTLAASTVLIWIEGVSMGRSHRVLRSAVPFLMVTGLAVCPRPSGAQQSETSLRALDYLPDPLARSPRLLAMGQLLLVEDIHNRLSLWDFAGNPTGIAEA